MFYGWAPANIFCKGVKPPKRENMDATTRKEASHLFIILDFPGGGDPAGANGLIVICEERLTNEKKITIIQQVNMMRCSYCSSVYIHVENISFGYLYFYD